MNRDADSRPKVFGIGFHKTATSSLARALRTLGYRVTGPNETQAPDIAERAWSIAQDLVPRFDAFQDNPWPMLFRELDEAYPGSRFILTHRPTENWIASATRHFEGQTTPMREWIYGAGAGNPAKHRELYIERYERHNREVGEYFAGRDDLLLMDITSGDGWGKLCPFLDLTTPDEAFPHANRAVDRERADASQRGLFGRIRFEIDRLLGR